MRYQLLSHPLTGNSPLYGKNPCVRAEPSSSIASGAASNAYMLHLHNHSGTHVDAPRHFREEGLTIADFADDFRHFDSVLLLNVPKEMNTLITAEDIKGHHQDIRRCELLLIRTGFEQYRVSDSDTYRLYNPGFTPEAASALRKHKRLRAVGVDLISIGPYQNRALGQKAHHAFFASGHSDEFVLLEDVHLVGIRSPDKVIVEPIFRMLIDASPVVIVATYGR